jgi:hypothetical protein
MKPSTRRVDHPLGVRRWVVCGDSAPPADGAHLVVSASGRSPVDAVVACQSLMKVIVYRCLEDVERLIVESSVTVERIDVHTECDPIVVHEDVQIRCSG